MKGKSKIEKLTRLEQREVEQGGTHQCGIRSIYSQSTIVKDEVTAAKQGLNKTTSIEVFEPSLAIIDTMTPIATNSPSSERGKAKS